MSGPPEQAEEADGAEMADYLTLLKNVKFQRPRESRRPVQQAIELDGSTSCHRVVHSQNDFAKVNVTRIGDE